jgi:16S rRNA (uracil1498-N3)-methyltransferase
MHRFFLPPQSIIQEKITFPQYTARQIRQVLRLQPGQQVVVLDNLGFEYLVELDGVNADRVTGKILEQKPAHGEPEINLALYLCLTQREKFEWVLQKCTELGVRRFVPVISSRSLVRRKQDTDRKKARWERIIQEAAEQCGRGRLPVLEGTLTFEGALTHAARRPALKVMPYEGESGKSLHHWLEVNSPSEVDLSSSDICILMGPEGGFTDREVGQAQRVGFTSVSLGSRILRMETAAVATTALILYAWSDLGRLLH